MTSNQKLNFKVLNLVSVIEFMKVFKLEITKLA